MVTTTGDDSMESYEAKLTGKGKEYEPAGDISDLERSTIPVGEELFAELMEHPAHLIRRSFQIFLSVFESEVGVFDITPVQWIMLATIYSFPGLEMTRLAGLAAVDKTSCGRAVSKLHDRGLVQVSPILEDRRQKRLSATQAGENMIIQALPGVRKLKGRLLGALSQKEQEAFNEALRVFVDRNNNQSRAPQRIAKGRAAKQKKNK